MQLDQVTAKLEEKQEHCSQLESRLREHREKSLSLEQKVEDLEGQIRVCIQTAEFVVFPTWPLWTLMSSRVRDLCNRKR